MAKDMIHTIQLPPFERNDSSSCRYPGFPFRMRTGSPAPAPAGLGQEAHGLLMADQLGVEQMVGRVHEWLPFPLRGSERMRGRLDQYRQRAAVQIQGRVQ